MQPRGRLNLTSSSFIFIFNHTTPLYPTHTSFDYEIQIVAYRCIMKRFKERALAASKPLPPPAPVGWEQDLGRETSSSRSSIRPEVKRLGPESENEVFSREFAYLLSQETKKGLYQPLDFDTFEIRLLRVHRDPKHFTLVCSLEYASLINPPEYTALSYRWGDASNMKGCVNIEGWGEIKITHSLERALLGLRQLDYTNDPHG